MARANKEQLAITMVTEEKSCERVPSLANSSSVSTSLDSHSSDFKSKKSSLRKK